MERNEVITRKCTDLVMGEFHWSLYMVDFLDCGKEWREVSVGEWSNYVFSHLLLIVH